MFPQRLKDSMFELIDTEAFIARIVKFFRILFLIKACREIVIYQLTVTAAVEPVLIGIALLVKKFKRMTAAKPARLIIGWWI